MTHFTGTRLMNDFMVTHFLPLIIIIVIIVDHIPSIETPSDFPTLTPTTQ
jgi:hypothetical protein